MPYRVEDDNADCPGGYAVVKEDDGDVMGCHDTVADAEAQITALEIAEAEADAAVAGTLPPSFFEPPTDPDEARAWSERRAETLATAMGRAIAELLRPTLDAAADDVVVASLDAARLDPLTGLWRTYVTEAVGEYVAGMFYAGSMQAWLAGPGGELAPEVALAWTDAVNENALAYQAAATNRIVGASADIWADVQQRSIMALRDGIDNDTLLAEIESITGYAQHRAEAIARTEVMSAYSGGDIAGARALGDQGPTHKRWLAAIDARTRDTHAAADGQLRPIGEPFDVGGVPMDRPLDPAAPPGEVVNCRCTMELLYPEDVPEE